MVKYQEFDDLTLSTKIQNLLDLIFPTFGLQANAAEDCDSYKSSEESENMDNLDLRKTLIKDFYNSDNSSEQRSQATPRRNLSSERKEQESRENKHTAEKVRNQESPLKLQLKQLDEGELSQFERESMEGDDP